MAISKEYQAGRLASFESVTPAKAGAESSVLNDVQNAWTPVFPGGYEIIKDATHLRHISQRNDLTHPILA